MNAVKRISVAMAIVTLWIVGANAQSVMDPIKARLDGVDARVGVAVIAPDGEVAALNNQHRFPLMSVMKLYQAVAVLDSVERSATVSLDTPVRITPDMLHKDTWSPMRDSFPGGTVMPLAEVLRYSLQQSDNNACDILFDLFGSPARMDSVLRGKGLDHFAITHSEDEMHRDVTLSYANSATPFSVAELIDRLLRWELLGVDETIFLVKTLSGCATGTTRIGGAPFPAGTTVGHKTGTGDKNSRGKIIGVNDAAFIKVPGKAPYILVMLVEDSSLSFPDTEQLIADISTIVYRYYLGQ